MRTPAPASPAGASFCGSEGMWLSRLAAEACQRVEWGFPDAPSINSAYLERELFRHGKVNIMHAAGSGLPLVLRGSSINLDQNGFPSEAISVSMYQSAFTDVYGAFDADGRINTDKDGQVVIFNTPYAQPTLPEAIHYAQELTLVDAALHTALINSMCSRLIKCDSPALRVKVLDALAAAQRGEPAVFVDDDTAPLLRGITEGEGGLKLFCEPAPVDAASLNDARNALLAAWHVWIGISDVVRDKRERLVGDEADAQEEAVMLAREVFMTPRREALERLKAWDSEHFASAWVRWRTDPIMEARTDDREDGDDDVDQQDPADGGDPGSDPVAGD